MDYLQRLRYHYQPEKGWMNDPNGLCWFQGKYHLFFQYGPHHEVPGREPIHWGHVTTTDFLHFETLPDALIPGNTYDRGGCWSGTAMEKDRKLWLLYASVIKNADGSVDQSISAAWSEDGISFEKVPENPVIPLPPAEGSRNFRDPAIAYDHGIYKCIVASGNREKTVGRLLVYESTDLIHWDYKGVAMEWPGARCTECPFLVPAGDRWLLGTSICYPDCHRFTVMAGHFEQEKFIRESEGCIDCGPDQYAGQAFSDRTGRCLMITWLPGWDYQNFAEKSLGCLSLPRELTFRDGKLRGAPAREVRHLLTDSDPAVTVTDAGISVKSDHHGIVEIPGSFEKVELLRDGYLLELFLNDGEFVYDIVL